MEEILKGILDIAWEAGAKILSIYHSHQDFGIEQKKDNSPVTIADKASNDIIVNGLRLLTPQIPIISEETKSENYQIRQNYQQCWIIDPLDGTKEFIQRNGDFTINIALVENGVPILGVAHVPVLEETFYAIKGKGAYVVKNEMTTKIQAKSFSFQDKGLKIACSRNHFDQDTADFLAQFDSPDMVSRGSSLKALLIAKGEIHIYPRFGLTSEWDTAAPQIILEEAGGKMIQVKNQKPLIYNKENLLNPAFIAMGTTI